MMHPILGAACHSSPLGRGFIAYSRVRTRTVIDPGSAATVAGEAKVANQRGVPGFDARMDELLRTPEWETG
jgi:hypothetical protein